MKSLIKVAVLIVASGMFFAGCSFKAELGTSLFGNSGNSGGYYTGLSSCGGE